MTETRTTDIRKGKQTAATQESGGNESGSVSSSGSERMGDSEATLQAQVVAEAQAEWSEYGPLVGAVLTMVLVVFALVLTAGFKAGATTEPSGLEGEETLARPCVGYDGRW